MQKLLHFYTIRLTRMDINKFIRMYGAAFIMYGVYNLFAASDYKSFCIMLNGSPIFLVNGAYTFSTMYGVLCVYCGMKIFSREDWARKVIIFMVSLSVVFGFIFSKMIMSNFREYVFSAASGIPPAQRSFVYLSAAVFTVLATVFELSAIVFFTRPAVAGRFRKL